MPEFPSLIEWWLVESIVTQGVPLSPPSPEVMIYTDASTLGWGAHLDGQVASGVWSPEWAARHINQLNYRQ